MVNPELRWTFPLPRPHCGIALGNGTQGVLVWGDEFLCLTIARAGFWDHRGGKPFTTDATFPRVREFLEANDEKGIKALFHVPETPSQDMFGAVESPHKAPDKPYQIGGGRLELHFPAGFKPKTGVLNRENGRVEVELQNFEGQSRTVQIEMSMDDEVSWLDGAADADLRLRPSWEWTGEALAKMGVLPPHDIEIADGVGFVQPLPADDALALVVRKRGEQLLVATALGDVEEASKAAVTRARGLPETDSSYFWKRYWADTPKVELPDAELQHFWDIALYKQAGITTPHGVAATLQGPWMEEYQLPPWSNDYHFNINAQMIYWPALATNRLEHFEPLWAMIREWMPVLKENGEKFFGRKGALMLPHAVDDLCQVVGTFWAGTIDHACTAWVAQMAWLHYRYGLDEKLLREVAWPLLNGAFEGYYAMHEEREGQFSLPISVSPEYRGSEMNAWGRDASFQLAAWHMIAQILPDAAHILGEEIDPRWHEVKEKLPPYCLVNQRIGLWEGLELEESHRHHSHLAAIWPFTSIDPLAPQHWEHVVSSIEFWNRTGAGQWTGWCIPWASVLCSRLGLTDAAVTWMHWLLDNFTNEGWASLHNADFPGSGAWHDGSFRSRVKPENNEVMQMDATMGFLIAVTELLVQNRCDAIHVLPKIPRRWKSFKFDGIRTEGAFFVGASVEGGKVVEVRVKSEKGGLLKIAPGFGEIIEREMSAGEELVLRA
jgi:hypothetical protein